MTIPGTSIRRLKTRIRVLPSGMLLLLFLIFFSRLSVDARLKATRVVAAVAAAELDQPKNEPSTRIVGGSKVQNNTTYPFFVNLGACAGVLIHGDIVLTAAHVSLRVQA
jgi:hypothetical protein